MGSLLTHEEIEDLLSFCGVTKMRHWKNDSLQICCPVHGEQHPSMSINAHWVPNDSNEVIQTAHCFSCGFSGSLPKLLAAAREDLFPNEIKAMSYIENKYHISYAHKTRLHIRKIKRYEEINFSPPPSQILKTKPLVTLAPFKSGKETYKYFFDRGFTKEEMQEYMIGRDLNLHTVTIPVFYQNKELAGVVGRILPKYCNEYSQRFHIYDFSKSGLLYPLDKVEVINNEIILVESQLDAILMRRWGYKNVLATMGGTLSRRQAEILINMCDKVILLFDNDNGGNLAVSRARSLLKGKILLKYVVFPENIGKDPSEWGEEVTTNLIKKAGIPKISRII